MKKTLLIFFLASLRFSLSAQAPFFKTHPLGEDYLQAKVERMHQDRSSLLWFGTTRGLFRFDGHEFQPFFKSDSSASRVTAIYHDTARRLWVGYEDGSIFFLQNGRLQRWMPEEGTPAAAVVAFAEDGKGRFWFATYGEGVYFQEKKGADGKPGRIRNFNSADDGLPGDDIYVMVADRQGRMWLGTDGGIGIASVGAGGRKRVEKITTADGLPDNIVREILPDAQGNFWIGMYDRGFCHFDVAKRQFSHPVPGWQHGAVSQLEIFEGRELWIGTEGEGVWRWSFFDKKLRRVESLPREAGGEDALRSAKIYDLQKDVEGNIWLVSNSAEGGVSHASRQFEFVQAPAFDNIQALLADAGNTLWIGTDKGVFTQESDGRGGSFFKKHLARLPLNVISLYEDRFGNIWLGTFGEGVFLFKPASGQMRRLTEKDGLPNGSVLSIAGSGGKVWLATLGGVVEFSLEKDPVPSGMAPSGMTIPHRNFNQESGLGTNFIYKVFADSKGRVWFGTDGKGAAVLENGKITSYTHARRTAGLHEGEPADVPLRAIYSIAEDRRGHIWLSTAKEGVFEFDGREFRHLTLKEGIRNLAITSLVATEKGEMLIVHPTGVDVLTPETGHVIYYGKEVGVENMNPHLNAACTDREGSVWIGAQRRIIRHTPLKEKLSIDPRTMLDGVSVFLEPVDFQHKSTFAPGENNLVFHYTGLWYTDPATVQYRYKLEGFNPGWIVSKDRAATYSNLPPGKYTFRVTSTENAAYLDEPVISYSFEVKAPLWRRGWFVALALAAAGGLFYWLLRERDRRLAREAALTREKIESQFEALKAQINPHFLFNSFNTLASIIEEDPRRAVKYVEHLSDFYRSILQFREREVISVEEECRVVESYAHLLRHRFGDNLRLQIELNGMAPAADTPFPLKGAFVVPLTLQMLVENAVKHNVISKTRPLVVRIHSDGGEWLVVENNLQPKLDQPPGTRYGLDSIATRYELLSDKKVRIEKTEEIFKVSIPLIKASS